MSGRIDLQSSADQYEAGGGGGRGAAEDGAYEYEVLPWAGGGPAAGLRTTTTVSASGWFQAGPRVGPYEQHYMGLALCWARYKPI